MKQTTRPLDQIVIIQQITAALGAHIGIENGVSQSRQRQRALHHRSHLAFFD